ncbi:MAG: tetratricopeptide repeat protein [Ignavibacteriae bacterium]|nr:tetratricopeptide repeat protein [Ignavibacteriota bacterium]
MTRPCIAYLLVAGLVVLSLRASSQTSDANNRYRLAQSYEQSGDFESAIKLYRDLASADPTNYMFFDGLRRSLLHLKRYDEAIGLIKSRLAQSPNDVNLLCMYGSAYYQSGNEKDAITAWERAIAIDPANQNIYRLVANTMMENRLLERAAEMYRRGRVACNDPNLFTMELAQLLAVTMDYAGATQEFLRYLSQAPGQLGYVQSRLAQFTDKQEARTAAIQVVRAAQKSSDDVNLHRLLGWLLLEGKQYDDAFEVYKEIDRFSNAQGNEIFSFAERAYKEGAYAAAAEAFKAAIDIPLAPQRLPFAKFGYALAMKELSVQADSSDVVPQSGSVPESRSRYATAIDYFRRIIAEYPNTDHAARSYYQIGTIQFTKYFDLDGALASFNAVEQFVPPMNTVLYDVFLKTGEVLTARGDTTAAAGRFRRVVAASNATPDQQDEATYRLAELEYFKGNFEEALRLLQTISANTKADYANDAIQLLTFLQENSISSAAPLKEFAQADLLSRQKKYSEATTALQKLIDKNPQALFVDDGLMKIASLQTSLRQYADALATYQRLLDQFKESSIALDKAQFNIAALYDYRLNEKTKALTAYEKLLADYPASLLVDQARKRIRELRGDSL